MYGDYFNLSGQCDRAISSELDDADGLGEFKTGSICHFHIALQPVLQTASL